MHTLTLLALAIAAVVLVFGRTSETQGVSEINEGDPPTFPSPSSPIPYGGIMAPEAGNKYVINKFEYSHKGRAVVPVHKLADFFKNQMKAETPSEPKAIPDGWFKKAVLRTQNDKEQPSGIDADKEDKPNIVIKSEFKSSGSIEFAPYFDPDKFGDEKKNVENGYTDDFNQTFATTPYDYGYYDSKIDTPTTVTQFETPRSIRQNVQSRTKTLVSDELDQLRSGLANKEYRFPVSLLPVNLRMLKINHPSTETPSKESSHETVSKKPQVFLYDGVQGANGSFYDVFMLAAICLGVALTLFGVMFGLYKFSITVKAPRRMDYPAYGVTGPTCDASTDTNLAKSAQMYHYQHQKQQMISMEKIGMDTRSVSDHESEEEGDYTVYECPGFATTGNMEVQNPIFDEGATQLRTTKVVIEPKV